MADEDTRQAAAHWGDDRRAAFYGQGGLMWSQLAAVQRRINAKISGAPERDWIDHLQATHLAGRCPVGKCLSLCCYEGSVERELAAREVFQHCVAYDVSEGALSRARELAAEAGYRNIEYVQQDVNTMVLAEEQYDVVVARAALHHISALEHVADQIRRGIKPDGILVVDDYVGPSRFDYSSRQLEICAAALKLLPRHFRRSVSWQRIGRVGPGAQRTAGAWLKLAWLKLRNGTLFEAITRRIRHARLRQAGADNIKESVPRIAGAEMAIDDPTEAVRAAEILPILEERFEIVERRPYGGSVLMPLLDDIAGNFAADEPEAQQLLEMLFAIEDALMACGALQSDFM